MNLKEIAVKKLKEIRSIANYNSDDFEANKRLKAIREQVDAALEKIENMEDSQ